MNFSRLTVLLLFFVTFSISAQKTIHNYAYVIVPKQFSFQKGEDQYQLNSLAKFLFNKNGLKAFFDDEILPQEFLMNPCNGLRLKVLKDGGMFKSKYQFNLLDCHNKIVFESKQGKSLEKDYKKSAHQGLRRAFESFAELKYSYKPLPSTIEAPIQVVEEIKKVTPQKVTVSKTYVNAENLSIALQENHGSYLGNVISSPTIAYAKNEVICKLFKTSLNNVFKAQWKNTDGNFINTIAYFDTEGNLKIDYPNPNGILIMTFDKVE